MSPHAMFVIVLGLLLVVSLACQADQGADRVRAPECADDMWYPSDPDKLGRMLDDFLSKADPPLISGKPAGLVCPHAGIRYSGPVAAAGYKTLKGQSYKRVFVFGFSHRQTFRGGAILPKVTHYATPLGTIPVDREVCDKLLAYKSKDFAPHEEVHRGEHSLEIQLPFLQRVLKDFKLVPIMVEQSDPLLMDPVFGRGQKTGQQAGVDPLVYDRMAEAIAPFVDADTLIVASSDFTHYGPRFFYVPFTDNIPENLRRIDLAAADRIAEMDVPGFLKALNDNGVGNPNYRRPQSICGWGTITLLMKVLGKVGTYRGVRLAYDTSGHMTNDYQHSVSYVSIGFSRTGDRPQPTASNAPAADSETLSPKERSTLLQLARDAATAALEKKGRLDPRSSKYELTEAMQRQAGAFVTLRNRGELRGCIGSIEAQGSLVDSVVDNAINAATRDYRFAEKPVTTREMPDITVEISVLSPLQRIQSPQEIVLGKHGVILSRGMNRAVFLPQVATETGWNLEAFLSHLSQKAGISADAWQKPGTRFQVFTVEAFSDEQTHKNR